LLENSPLGNDISLKSQIPQLNKESDFPAEFQWWLKWVHQCGLKMMFNHLQSKTKGRGLAKGRLRAAGASERECDLLYL